MALGGKGLDTTQGLSTVLLHGRPGSLRPSELVRTLGRSQQPLGNAEIVVLPSLPFQASLKHERCLSKPLPRASCPRPRWVVTPTLWPLGGFHLTAACRPVSVAQISQLRPAAPSWPHISPARPPVPRTPRKCPPCKPIAFSVHPVGSWCPAHTHLMGDSMNE